jgi:hypothetical protein
MFLVIVEPHEALHRYAEVARRKGFRTLVLTSDVEVCKAGERDYNHTLIDCDLTNIDQIIECDTTSSKHMLEALRPFQGWIAGVVAGHDLFVPLIPKVGRELGLDYSRPEDGPCQQLKTAMKERLAERNVRTAKFVVARSLDDTINAWEGFGRDCIVKMVDFVGSFNVFRVTTREQVEKAWTTIIYNRGMLGTPFPQRGEVLVEQFIGGRELSIEGYEQADRIVVLNSCEKITESNFVVVGHLVPAELNHDEKQQLRRIAQECVRALGIRNSVFHIEVHMRGGSPYVIECASRPPGQHIVELIHRSYGLDLMEISIDLATGRIVKETWQHAQLHHAMVALYTKKSGIFGGFEGLEECRQRGGLVHAKFFVKEGDRVEALSAFNQLYGLIVLEGSGAHELRERFKWVREHLTMIVADAPAEAHDGESRVLAKALP